MDNVNKCLEYNWARELPIHASNSSLLLSAWLYAAVVSILFGSTNIQVSSNFILFYFLQHITKSHSRKLMQTISYTG